MSKLKLADGTNPETMAGGARARRWAELLRCFPDLPRMRVLDLGGTPDAWRIAPVQPKQVVIVNINKKTVRQRADESKTVVIGDACDLPHELANERFDLVYSNSLIEHVGGHVQRQRFADMVHKHAEHHWVQTPYRYFPVEPHWVFPAMQWLPFRTRVMISQYWPYGHMKRSGKARAIKNVAGVELLSVTEMRSYFPDSQIWRERMLGLPKSLTARTANPT